MLKVSKGKELTTLNDQFQNNSYFIVATVKVGANFTGFIYHWVNQ